MTTVHSAQNPITVPAPQPPRRSGAGWFVTGTLVLLAALALLIAGAAVRIVDDSWRHDGYLTSGDISIATESHAIATDRIDLAGVAPRWPDYDSLLGKMRLRATGSPGAPVFVGIAPADKVESYLNGVSHATITELKDPVTTYSEHPGGAPRGKPADQSFWTAQASGSGTQTVDWPLADGTWTIVVMNADGSTGVGAALDIGVTVPVLQWAGRVLLGASAAAGLLGILLVVVGFRRRR